MTPRSQIEKASGRQCVPCLCCCNSGGRVYARAHAWGLCCATVSSPVTSSHLGYCHTTVDTPDRLAHCVVLCARACFRIVSGQSQREPEVVMHRVNQDTQAQWRMLEAQVNHDDDGCEWARRFCHASYVRYCTAVPVELRLRYNPLRLGCFQLAIIC